MSEDSELRFDLELIRALRHGAVGVMPTDTIYGVVASALDRQAVQRVYELRQRDKKKPFIILISSIAALGKLGVKLDKYHRAFLREAWPGPISIVLPVPAKKFEYLHRGKRSLAFRVPADEALRELLRRTGPLVAPSANPESKKPAETIKEAQKYFGAAVDIYADAGRVKGKPSSLIDLTGKEPAVLRK